MAWPTIFLKYSRPGLRDFSWSGILVAGNGNLGSAFSIM